VRRRLSTSVLLGCAAAAVGCVSPPTPPPRPATSRREPEYVYLLGQTNTRGRIPIVAGPTPFTLVKLIAMGGDFTPSADRRNVQVVRTTDRGRETRTFDVDAILDGRAPDFELQADDVVSVPEALSPGVRAPRGQ
jgi:protein involved in polysaccharide export with SLBB domain